MSVFAGASGVSAHADAAFPATAPCSQARALIYGAHADTGAPTAAKVSAYGSLQVTDAHIGGNTRVCLSATDIAATAYYALVDLSNDSGDFPHTNTGAVHASQTEIHVDPASNSAGSVALAVITRIDGTDADLSVWQRVGFEKSGGVQIERARTFLPHVDLRVAAGATAALLTNDRLTNVAAVNTGSTLSSPDGAVTPAVGDVVCVLTHTSGSAWDFSVCMQYHAVA